MSEEAINFICGVAGLYALAITVVIFSGGVPTRWQTWPVVHAVALIGIPGFFAVLALMIAFPGLIILAIIIAATSRPRA
ncbi:hypothetical protein GJQ54_05410 [Oceanospirillaceae bacterium ASx5O]|nr:hypothetical protein GJQ54_05410 [Oceanospirillaceae bacterium ASx5O]